MMGLTPEEAARLGKIWKLLYEASRCLEEMRPAGGFKEYINKEFCKECGGKKEGREDEKTRFKI